MLLENIFDKENQENRMMKLKNMLTKKIDRIYMDTRINWLYHFKTGALFANS